MVEITDRITTLLECKSSIGARCRAQFAVKSPLFYIVENVERVQKFSPKISVCLFFFFFVFFFCFLAECYLQLFPLGSKLHAYAALQFWVFYTSDFISQSGRRQIQWNWIKMAANINDTNGLLDRCLSFPYVVNFIKELGWPNSRRYRVSSLLKAYHRWAGFFNRRTRTRLAGLNKVFRDLTKTFSAWAKLILLCAIRSLKRTQSHQ